MFASELTPEQELFLMPYFEKTYGSQNDSLLIHIVRYYREYNCTPEIIDRLVKYVAINSVNKTNTSALMVAVKYSATTSSIEAVQALINAGADLNLQNKNGWTALMLSARYSNDTSSLDTVQALMNAGADLNLRNKNGCTATEVATLEAYNMLLTKPPSYNNIDQPPAYKANYEYGKKSQFTIII